MPRQDQALDEAIIEILGRNGRITHQALATALGISRPAAGRHLHRILASGSNRVVGVVHPAVQGITFIGHISVMVDGDPQEIAERITELEHAAFVSITAGVMSLVAEVRAYTNGQFESAIDYIRALPGVVSTDTVVYGEVLLDMLETAHIDVPKLDRVDEQLMRHLQVDGRTSYSRLAELCGISVAVARNRTLRLLESGVVKLGVMRDVLSGDSRQRVGVGLKIRGGVPLDVRKLLLPDVQFVARSLGRYDLVLTLNAATRDETIDVLAAIAQVPGVHLVDSWVHLRSVKELY